MKKKLITIGLICIFLLSSLAVYPTTGMNFGNRLVENKIIDNKETDDYQKPEFWAVLVGSNPYPKQDGDRFIIPTIELKKVLCEGGWKEDHIKLLTDQVKKRDVFNALSWLQRNARPIDTVLIYLHDHGLENNFVLYSSILNQRRLWYWQLDRKLDRIDCAGMVIMISACQSGTAIKWLKGYKRVILTSSDIDEHWGFNSLTIQMGLSGLADLHEDVGNKNGYVSIEELYEYYIKEQFSNPDHPCYPRIQDDYDGQLSLTFHNWTDDKIDQIPNHLPDARGRSGIGDNGLEQVAQSFIPTYENLTRVGLLIENHYLENAYPITVTIRKDLYGENLTSSTIIPYELENGSVRLLMFDFPDINVTPEETYYIICSSLESEDYLSGYYLLNTGIGSDCYDSGICYRSSDGGETWWNYDEVDISFITYGKDNEEENHRPYTPIRPIGPVKGKKNKDYTFYVSTQDYEGDQIYYRFEWDDFNYSDWIGPYDPGEIVCVSHNWSKKGSYHVRVTTKDDNNWDGYWSYYSDTLRVDISRSKLNIKLEEFFDDYRVFYKMFSERLGWNIGH